MPVFYFTEILENASVSSLSSTTTISTHVSLSYFLIVCSKWLQVAYINKALYAAS